MTEKLIVYVESPDGYYVSTFDTFDEFMEGYGFSGDEDPDFKGFEKDDDGYYVAGEYRFRFFKGREVEIKPIQVVKKYKVE